MAEQAAKIQTLRRVFHRAVLVPVDNLDELWRVRAWIVLVLVCGRDDGFLGGWVHTPRVIH